MSDKNRLIRAIRMNAVFSAFCTLAMLMFANWIAMQLGLPGAVQIYVLAGILLLFVLQLANIVRSRIIRSWEITAIIGADLLWVGGSFLTVTIYYDVFTPAGLVMIDVVAFAVLFFAVQQIRGLKEFRTIKPQPELTRSTLPTR
jgi:hypothetical protein